MDDATRRGRWEEARRLLKSHCQREVARRLRVSESTISRWKRKGGPPKPAGRPSRLGPVLPGNLRAKLLEWAEGLDYDVRWTRRTVANLFKERLDVSYDVSQITRILRSIDLPLSALEARTKASPRNAWKRFLAGNPPDGFHP